ncbi:uncharacterized protein PV09_05565 [Verruconis gallopava]|uniref:PhoD-like phosphatase domain-containing protein n=1 Tax=Verruconis gallopava TaxID=253628 RepID=A0A0D1YRV9_9PEZI|nr:uncharacterized protein PV09_05565 [Verruconis gallopava]KIW03357.1 hypothetical protein PV09_05565 [Verruconis gallopava]
MSTENPNTAALAQSLESNGGIGAGPQVPVTSTTLEIVAGPLINYRRQTADTTWHGSVLLVTKPTSPQPVSHIECVDMVGDGPFPGGPPVTSPPAVKLYEDPDKTFWRFSLDIPIQTYEARWQYALASPSGVQITRTFVVPSKSQSMRIMFHSCNGFSVGTDVDAWNGPALWNDVLRMHEQQPFHVMIGGGDQIYNDGVRVDGPLKPWTNISNPKKRRDFLFSEEMRRQCDEYYFKNYVRWYGQEPFKSANAIIPQINIWDDHDIIDGFGSYTDHFMRCHVFRGIGGVAHKYYMLFQHHLPPPKSTFTSDAPATIHTEGSTTAPDPEQLKDSWVLTGEKEDPAYIIGAKPGPYVEEHSRNIYCQLGARIAFAGIDARTERTRHQVNYPETYQKFFERLDAELSANKNIKHLILLLGVPIAYPRLQWLENIFSSPIMGPVRLLNKRFGLAGGLFNQFDGQVDLLDDLDDHYTARHHKSERRELIQRLQKFSKDHSVRVSILGGDVHLAAIGRFYSNPKLNIAAEHDWRYMPNIISSAITNKPPPQAVANLLAKRNKIHHLDHDTDETLLEIFNHDPGMHPEKVEERKTNGDKGPGKKSADSNHATMPSRNYAIIAESHDAALVTSTSATNGASNGNTLSLPAVDTADAISVHSDMPGFKGRKPNPRLPIHLGEERAGTEHPAASGLKRTGLCGRYGLDVTLRVEISNKDPEGKTEGYGFSIPALDCKAYEAQGTRW